MRAVNFMIFRVLKIILYGIAQKVFYLMSRKIYIYGFTNNFLNDSVKKES